ncbi:hypothetical protein NK718_00125 [Alsobacter sp. SYSU M60028]|uniref:Uncharacterized protein n=1 Tax=Alsobacter ponti TaxID=2962936 RepID=A0ABT1L6J3_9HYPH|nr:hypothetical protein [Alsobacter ponti]MCP8936909.1 hypothetical protein [Alsobacter ponti]
MATIPAVNARTLDRRETLFVALALAVAMLGTGGFALLRATGGPRPPELLDWQVSAFRDLGPDDQAIHSSLSVAAEEIGGLNFDFGDWPKPEELDKLLIPPFYKDDFWEQHGRVQWRQLNAADFNRGGDTSYLGVGGSAPGQSAYLLIFRHRHIGSAYTNQTEIWVHRDVNVGEPDGYRAEALAKAGWRQVVAYRGADEAEHQKGH